MPHVQNRLRMQRRTALALSLKAHQSSHTGRDGNLLVVVVVTYIYGPSATAAGN